MYLQLNNQKDEVWVKQRSASDATSEVVITCHDDDRRNGDARRHRKPSLVASYLRRLRIFRFVAKKLDIEDRAKRADYVSRKSCTIMVVED